MALALEVMNKTHLDWIIQIETAVFSNPWQRRDFEFAMMRDNSVCRVVKADDVMVGYLVGFVIDREFHLADFAVAPSYQRRGVGRQALDLLFEVLGEKTQVVSLEVRMSNQAAIYFYKKMGFETMAIRQGYYTRPSEDALVMLKPLNSRLSDWVANVLPNADRWERDG